MKKPETILREFVSRLSLDNLKYLNMRLNQRIGSDMSEAIDLMAGSQDVDKWLATARTCDDFYDMVDLAQSYVERELHRRAPDLVEA